MRGDSPVTEIRGVGEAVAKKFKILGIETVDDLINYFPRRYDDYSEVQNIKSIQPGPVTIEATIKQVVGRYVRRGLHVTEAVASDETGSVKLVWFNQPYRASAIKRDVKYYISGDFTFNKQRLSINNPSMELVSDFPVSTARIVPVYKETKGLKSAVIRKSVSQCRHHIDELPEVLPKWLIKQEKLLSYSDAVMAMHFPGSKKELELAKQRLGFQEVFEITLAALLNKQELLQEVSVKIPFIESVAQKFVGHLPFKLTDAQRKAIWRIYKDMEKSQPMNRLVEGDVGSGKTVVAAMAGVMALEQGFQVALMAPTELLARQHAETIHNLLEPLGYGKSVGLLVGGMTTSQKERARKAVASGNISFIIGTHALIQEKVDMHKLGLVVIDEQHRFGVEQRKSLQAKAGHMPHVLSMTATPIPRTLALTLFGELDISVIDTKPEGRKPIITKLCSPNSRKQLYEAIDLDLAAGRQMFVVCPLITESSVMDVRSAEKVFEDLSKGAFKHRRVGLLHGKMKPQDKDSVMQEFVEGKLDILVSTTVIEVGVNVPEATVMLIENAERFGLAQIHQLRGRVGRSQHQGYCYLMLGNSQQPSRRLRALEQSSNGFELAELDLEIRGPGAIYGSMQHGQLDLRVATLTDTLLIERARTAAQTFIDKDEDLLQYSHIYANVSKYRAVTNLN